LQRVVVSYHLNVLICRAQFYESVEVVSLVPFHPSKVNSTCGAIPTTVRLSVQKTPLAATPFSATVPLCMLQNGDNSNTADEVGVRRCCDLHYRRCDGSRIVVTAATAPVSPLPSTDVCVDALICVPSSREIGRCPSPWHCRNPADETHLQVPVLRHDCDAGSSAACCHSDADRGGVTVPRRWSPEERSVSHRAGHAALCDCDLAPRCGPAVRYMIVRHLARHCGPAVCGARVTFTFMLTHSAASNAPAYRVRLLDVNLLSNPHYIINNSRVAGVLQDFGRIRVGSVCALCTPLCVSPWSCLSTAGGPRRDMRLSLVVVLSSCSVGASDTVYNATLGVLDAFPLGSPVAFTFDVYFDHRYGTVL
jgi:hypothetical protein